MYRFWTRATKYGMNPGITCRTLFRNKENWILPNWLLYMDSRYQNRTPTGLKIEPQPTKTYSPKAHTLSTNTALSHTEQRDGWACSFSCLYLSLSYSVKVVPNPPSPQRNIEAIWGTVSIFIHFSTIVPYQTHFDHTWSFCSVCPGSCNKTSVLTDNLILILNCDFDLVADTL